MLVTAANATVLFHNQRLLDLWGMNADEFLHGNWAAKLAERFENADDLSVPSMPDDDALNKGGRTTRKLKDGRWFEQSCRRVALADGSQVSVWRWSDVTATKQLEASLQFSHDLLNKLSTRVPGIIFKFKMWPDGRSCFPYMSDAVSTMYPGVTPDAIKESAKPFFAFRHPDDAAGLAASMMKSAQSMEPWDHEYRLVLPDKGVVWRHGNARPELQDDGSIAWHGFITDITDRKLIEHELRLTSSVFNTSGEGILVVDTHNKVVTVNPSFSRITGYCLAEVVGQDPKMLASGRHDVTFFAQMWEDVKTKGSWQGEIWNRRKDGEVYPQWMRITTVLGQGNLPGHRIAVFADISEQKKTDEHIWRQANFDVLTNLPNRRLLIDRMRQEIRKTSRNSSQIALLFVDLDHFKEVNDTLGHDLGDQLLVEAASRLNDCVRKADTVARLGGDEFTIMLVDPDVVAIAERIADVVETRLALPFQLGAERVFVSASIGITVYPNDANDVESLFRNADQAMYAAKKAGRNQHSWYTPGMQVAAHRRRRLAKHLRDALQRDQLEVHYQPIVDMQTRHITKAEALLRWNSPDMPMVGPAEFIPIAEELGLINDIGEWVFQQVAHTVRSLNVPGQQPVQIAVNMSPKQFGVEHAGLHWGQHLHDMGVDANCIIVEITEGLLLDTRQEVIQKLKLLHEAGLQVALDDFGTGYSAMSYLLKFNLDILKIDQSFVRNVNTPAGRAIVEAIVAMAHKLGLKVVAEGVEHMAEMAFLSSIDCDFAQGYLFSRPVSPAAFSALIQQDRSGLLLDRSLSPLH